MPTPSRGDLGDMAPEGALGELAARLSPAEYRATLTTRRGLPTCLCVTNRRAAHLTEDIYAGDGWFWWSWAERICPVTDPGAAATKIAHVLRALPEVSRG